MDIFGGGGNGVMKLGFGLDQVSQKNFLNTGVYIDGGGKFRAGSYKWVITLSHFNGSR